MRSLSRRGWTLLLGFVVAVPAALACNPSGGGSGGETTPPPAPGGTGAFGVVTVDGKQKMYLPQTIPNPAGHGMVAVVDVGVAGNGVAGAPALLTDIDLGTPDMATATGGDATMVVAVSTHSNNVWFIDPHSDTLVGTLQLDATYGRSSFSGGGGYVTGVTVDSANHRAILSVWNGFALVDLDSKTVTQVISAPPSENFGFDSVHQRILAPFYDCRGSSSMSGPPAACADMTGPDGKTPMTHGLNVIDLTDGTVYTYQDPTASDPNAPVGTEPDSAAADPTTGVAVVPSEGGNFENVIDFSKATFDKSSKTVTAPHREIMSLGLTGVAVDHTAHLAFWEEEFSSEIAVADLSQANAGGASYVQAQLPLLPGGLTFSNPGDPHGIAVSVGIADGQPVGFVVDFQMHWVARVDLPKLAALAPADGGTEPDPMTMQSVVTYLDARTKE
jgi:hypothetical protein